MCGLTCLICILKSDAIHEKLFKQVDFNGTQTVDYFEFREIFLHLCDVKRELEDRGIEVPSMTFRFKPMYSFDLIFANPCVTFQIDSCRDIERTVGRRGRSRKAGHRGG